MRWDSGVRAQFDNYVKIPVPVNMAFQPDGKAVTLHANLIRMKTQVKSLSISSAPVPHAGAVYGAGSAGTVSCVNLRPPGKGLRGLVPVGEPQVLLPSGGWRPVCSLAAGGDDILLLNSGRLVATVPPDVPGPVAVSEETLPSEVRCACPDGVGRAVLCGDGYLRHAHAVGAGDVTLRDYGAEAFPPVSLRAEPGDILMDSVADVRLSRAYSAGEDFSAADAKSLSSALETAYSRLVANAAATGAYVQPALARYRLRDSRGRVLFESAPLLLGHDEGSQCSVANTFTSTDGQLACGFEISARSWRVVADVPAAADATGINVEVLLTPQLHPWLPGASPDVYSTRGGTDLARVSLPGSSRLRLSQGSESGVRIVREAVARMPLLESCVGSCLFSASSQSLTFRHSPASDARTEASGMAKACRGAFPSVSPVPRLLRMPNTATASCVCADSGDAVAWGNLTSRRYRGHSPKAFSSTAPDSPGSWETYVKVTFRDGGETCVRTGSGTSGAPLKHNPVLSYPDPDAVAMQIAVRYGSRFFGAEYVLSPDPSGQSAVYVSPTFGPVTLPELPGVTYTVPSENRLCHGFGSAVAIAPASAPLDFKLYADCGAQVRAVACGSRRQQSWEFGRSTFYVFTASGILRLTSGAGMSGVAARMVDHRGIAAHDAVADSGDGTVYALAGLPGTNPDLVAVGQSGVDTLVSSSSFVRLAWVGRFRELWAFGSPGARVFCVDAGMGFYRRPDAGADEVFAIGGDCYLASEDRILRPSVETQQELTDVAWSGVALPRPFTPLRPFRLCLRATSAMMKGSVKVSASSHDGAPRGPVAASFGISGEVRSPLLLGLLCRHMQGVHVDFKAAVSSDFILDSAEILCRDGKG